MIQVHHRDLMIPAHQEVVAGILAHPQEVLHQDLQVHQVHQVLQVHQVETVEVAEVLKEVEANR